MQIKKIFITEDDEINEFLIKLNLKQIIKIHTTDAYIHILYDEIFKLRVELDLICSNKNLSGRSDELIDLFYSFRIGEIDDELLLNNIKRKTSEGVAFDIFELLTGWGE